MGETQDRTLTEAVARVIDAGERFLTARLDLIRAETGRLTGLSAALLAGAALALLGWVVLMAAVILALTAILSPVWSLTIVGGAHFVAGLFVAAVAARGLSAYARPAAAREVVEGPQLRAHTE